MDVTCGLLHERCTEWRLARNRSDALFTMIGVARISERPIPDRHRFLFYRGHLEAFDWNLLGSRLEGSRNRFKFDTLFGFGIDPAPTNLPNDKVADWPSSAEIDAYVDGVRDDLDRLLNPAMSAPNCGSALATLEYLLHIAIEHRLMHVETLAYMLAQANIERCSAQICGAHAPVQMLRIPQGTATLGAPAISGGTFAWDNEFDEHAVSVPAFEISRCMVTNNEYLEFIEAKGYACSEFWRPADWQWRCREQIEHPLSWRQHDASWYVCTVMGTVPLPSDWPVYVSYAEACAYACWRGMELPTEAQWHRAAYGTPEGYERAYPWGDAVPEARHGNFDFHQSQPQPVETCPDGDSAFGVRGLLGNGWEWTKSIFAPFKGFHASPYYPGYSSDFFDGDHYVLKGASPFTARRFLRRSFRNWFRPHYPYVFAGFRCVRNPHD